MRTAVYTIVLALCATSLLTTVEAVQISTQPTPNVKPSAQISTTGEVKPSEQISKGKVAQKRRKDYSETIYEKYNYKLFPNDLNADKTDEAKVNIDRYNSQDRDYNRRLQAFFKALVDCRMKRKSSIRPQDCLAVGKPLRKDANKVGIKEIDLIDKNYPELIIEAINLLKDIIVTPPVVPDDPVVPEVIKPIQEIEEPIFVPNIFKPKTGRFGRGNDLYTWANAMKHKIPDGKVSGSTSEIRQLKSMLELFTPENAENQKTEVEPGVINNNITQAVRMLGAAVFANTDRQLAWKEAVEVYIN